MTSTWTFRPLQGKAGLAGIQAEWSELTDRIRTKRFCHFYGWYRAYLMFLEEEANNIIFYAAYRQNKIAAILPFRRREKVYLGITLRILELPYHKHFNLRDVILDTDGENSGLFKDFLCFLKHDPLHKCDIVKIEKVLPDSNIKLLTDLYPCRTRSIKYEGHCDYLPISHDTSLSKKLSKNLRNNLRKYRNKLATYNKVEFITCRQTTDLHQCFEDFLHIEASGWKGISGKKTAIKLHEPLVNFYQALIDYFSAWNGCEINILKVDDQAIAGQFILIAGDTMYVLKVGYDEEWAHLSPGNLLLAHIMERHDVQHHIRHINLITDAAWHSRWKPERYEFYNCTYYNRTLKGLVSFSILWTRQQWQQASRRISRSLRIKHTPSLTIRPRGKSLLPKS